ncbi:MAG: glycogen synthase GlgA, partial [Candidatus Methylomirabilis sp.]|nr:glycogen synthase GlgA [Deltaproteobacteria bacterium]
VASEVFPFSKTGGLADMVGAMAAALAARGHAVTVVTPLYRQVDRTRWDLRPVPHRAVALFPWGPVFADLKEARLGGARVLFVDQPAYFGRDHMYDPPGGSYWDNGERFAFFCWAALDALVGAGERIDVLHVHDWQAAMVPYFRRAMTQSQVREARVVLTIHNLAHQGNFPPWSLDLLGPDAQRDYGAGVLEFHGAVGYLKTGAIYSDRITTVSPTYAREILTPRFGCGMDAVLRMREPYLRGILNGADYGVWDPSVDRYIPARYTVHNRKPKAVCKVELQKRIGLPADAEAPLIGMVGRLTHQKGWDLLAAALERLCGMGAQLAILGAGDPHYEGVLRWARDRFGDRVGVWFGYDEEIAHWIEAGADMFLMPSLYEPCGLNQIYSLRYGTIPIVHAVGGLEDTVDQVDEKGGGGTGFKFWDYTPEAMLGAVEFALRIFRDRRAWRALMGRAMARNFSWDAAAEQYETLFRETLAAS